jgi:hypothetical protein
MDDMMWRSTRRTSSPVVVVLTHLSFVRLHTWQTRRGVKDYGQRDLG